MGDELAMGGAQTGTDIDGQIRAGIEAFMQSQDPAIAVEVVTMLAEVYGIAPQIDPYADPGMQADPYAQQVPAASNGMRFYRKGGKFVVSKKKVKSVNSYATGGKINPKKPKQSGNINTVNPVLGHYKPSPLVRTPKQPFDDQLFARLPKDQANAYYDDVIRNNVNNISERVFDLQQFNDPYSAYRYSIGPNRSFAVGGSVDPKKPKNQSITGTIQNPGYTPLNPKTTPQMNRMHAQNNLNTALRLKNSITGTNRNVIPANTNIIGNNVPMRFGSGVDANGVGNNYTVVPPSVQLQADSVINASRRYLYPTRQFENGGKLDLDGPPELTF